MSLQLEFQSFEWERFDKLLHRSRDELVELISAEVACERELASAKGYRSEFEVLPTDAEDLTQAIRQMITADDWYACFEEHCWSSIDWLMWRSFCCAGFLGAALGTQPRTDGVLIETADVACPSHPHHLRSETYRMGHRRFRHAKSPVYPDETNDDPGYSIHAPEQVRQILLEISEFDHDRYPDQGIKRNFRDDFLQPIRYCSEMGLAILSRWS